MVEQLQAAGEESVEEKDVTKLYKALRKVEHAKVRLVLSMPRCAWYMIAEWLRGIATDHSLLIAGGLC